MGRLPRFDAPGAIHHVFTQGVGPSPIFHDADDYDSFAAIARRTCELFDWTCLAHCLMTTHYHLIVRTREANLSAGMQRLNSRYAQSFNRRRGRRGHLFGSRFGSVFVQTHEHLLAEVRYLALNPLDAGILPAESRYSSYGAAIAGRRDTLSDTGALLSLVGGRDALRTFVEDGLSLRRAA